jgi:hypothetical protein
MTNLSGSLFKHLGEGGIVPELRKVPEEPRD